MSGASGSFPALIHAVSENKNLYRIKDNDDILILDLNKKIFSTNADLGTRKTIEIDSI